MSDEDRDDSAEEEAEPLRTREVFLDAEAYRRLNYDLTKSTIQALFEHVHEDRLRLHITDITLAEARAYFTAQAAQAVKEVNAARATLAAWQRRAPSALGKAKVKPVALNAERIADEAFSAFRSTLSRKGAVEHPATAHPALPVFQAYFRGDPPFEGKAKEFPDAFAIESLATWAEQNSTTMYIVTHDRAMLRAAGAKPSLRPVEQLATLLQMATISHSPDVEDAVEEIVATPTFVASLADALDETIGDVGVIYSGDLFEGEAEEMARSGDPQLTDWTVISAHEGSYGLIVEFDVEVLAQVSHEDISMAMYDREDGIYIGARTANAEVEDKVSLRMFVQTDSQAAISRSEMLTYEVTVSGSSESDYY